MFSTAARNMGSLTRRHRNTHTKPTGLGSLISHQLTQPEVCGGFSPWLGRPPSAPYPKLPGRCRWILGKGQIRPKLCICTFQGRHAFEGTGVGGGAKKGGTPGGLRKTCWCAPDGSPSPVVTFLTPLAVHSTPSPVEPCGNFSDTSRAPEQ